jgi:hypothetical protein
MFKQVASGKKRCPPDYDDFYEKRLLWIINILEFESE